MKNKIMRIISAYLFLIFFSCNDKQGSGSVSDSNATKVLSENKTRITAMLDSFHQAAAHADYEAYFRFFSEDAVFMGTDATEHWDKPAFMLWAKPHFDRKKAWDFSAVDRHIYLSESADIAWFDELLDAPFAKICRGSGVLVKQKGSWKVTQYVLSMTIPNQVGDSVRNMKAPIEDSLLQALKHQSAL